MKALAVFPKERAVRIIGIPEPEIEKPDQVKLRVLQVGVCGTDREVASFEYGTPPQGSDHLIIGHESFMEVAETGRNVTKVKPGDLVVATVRRPCPVPSCFACRHFHQDFCFTGKFKERGIKEAHGFMTEYALDEEKYLNVLPADLRETGVLTEPLTIAQKALSQLLLIQKRLPWGCPSGGYEKESYCHRAAVLGAGPVGLLGAMALRLRGFDAWVYSREPADSVRAAICRDIGAHYVSAADKTLQVFAEMAGNIDAVYEATGAAKVCFEALQYLGTNGVFILTGVPGRDTRIEVHASEILRNAVLKNQVVLGTVNAGREDYEAAAQDILRFEQKWPGVCRRLISKRVKIEECREALFSPGQEIKTAVTFV